MRRSGPIRHQAEQRSGMTLWMFAILLPVLLGMVGLVIDGGLLMASHRQVQNAADSAALAAASDKHRGSTDTTALASANSFLASNGMTGITLALNAGASNALNIPPQDPGNTGSPSPYKGVANYVEAIVTRQVNTFFMPLLGINSRQVTARAVAGFEPVGSGEGAIVLDPAATPGLAISGNNTQLVVNGTVVVNSQGGGLDQYGDPVSGPQKAITYRQDPLDHRPGRPVGRRGGHPRQHPGLQPGVQSPLRPGRRRSAALRAGTDRTRSAGEPADADDEQRRPGRLPQRGRGQSIQRPDASRSAMARP